MKHSKTYQDKHVKNNDICKDSLSFPVGSTIAVECDYGGSWTHGVIKQTNSSVHKGRLYIVRVAKTASLIPQNKSHIWSTSIATEQFLMEQIKKGLGWLGGIFMETMPVEHGGLFKSCTAASWMCIVHNVRWGENNSNILKSDRWEESNHVTPIQQSQEAYFRHIVCDDKLGYITGNNIPTNMIIKSNPHSTKDDPRTR